jgi:hypothetical protein
VTTKERIQAAIEHVEENDLDELYKLVKDFSDARRNSKQSLMSKLKSISIDAPEDFSANFDLYTSGERRAEPDLH